MLIGLMRKNVATYGRQGEELSTELNKRWRLEGMT